MPRQLLTRRWVLTTLLVLAGVAVCIRLGIWQLDRLAARKEFNARVEAQLTAPELDLNRESLGAGLVDREYRSVTVSGEYDFGEEVLLRNQVYDSRLGYHVFTPLKISGSDQSILVERGWIPKEDADAAGLQKYRENGRVTVKGVLRRSMESPDFGGVPNPTLAPGQNRLEAWSYINLAQIQQQSQLKLLPVYIQQAPAAGLPAAPVRELILPEISEGPHLGYALQWFTFATILGVGYPFFVRQQLKAAGRKTASEKA